MEIILNQRFSYAKITPYKNYSTLPKIDRSPSGIYKQLSYEDKYGGNTTTAYYDGDEGIGLTSLPDDVKKRRTRYFYWDDNYNQVPIVRYASKHKVNGTSGVFHTTKDRHIKKYYNEPFGEISVHILERSIIRKGDKITIKTYKYTKYRGFNCKYFKSHSDTHSLTLDLAKGDFLIVSGGKRKVKSSQFRKNSFYHLNNFFDNGDGPFKFIRNHLSKNVSIYDDLVASINDVEFNNALGKTFGISFPTDTSKFKTIFYDEIMRWFVKTKKIKTPNDYSDLLVKYYPTEKYLKKNDRKLIASILDVFEIKSKVTIKLLHEKPNLHLPSLIKLCYLFGDKYQKYIGSIKNDMFGNGLDRNDSPASSLKMMKMYVNDHKNQLSYDISDIEKENLLKVLTIDPQRGPTVMETYMSLIIDHFRMLSRIREYDPNIRMRATTPSKFHEEHTELSKLMTQIKKGWVMQYFYPEKTLNDIQQPIKVFKSIKIGPTLMGTDMDDYISIYPYVLTREEEYVEEGKFMHHCVATYAETDTSMIVSLRTENQQDRVTCEFNISDGRLVQSRHFSNGVPPKYFEHSIEHISDIIRLHARFGTLNWLKKDRVAIKINGIEIPMEKREPRRLIDILDLDRADPLPF
jgi:hypothetical protein